MKRNDDTHRWRDSRTGRFLTDGQASRKPPANVEYERVKRSTPPKKR